MRLRANRLPSVAEGVDLALGMSAPGEGECARQSEVGCLRNPTQ